MNNPNEIFGMKIPPPVKQKIGTFEIVLDSILLAIFIIIAIIWGFLWLSIWIGIAIPLFIALLIICYFFEIITKPFRREK